MKNNGIKEVLRSLKLKHIDTEYIKSAIIVILTTYVSFRYIMHIDVLLYVLFITSNIYVAVFVALEVSIILLTFVSWFIFFYYNINDDSYKSLLNIVLKLPLYNRLYLTSITMFHAIPNKVYVHNNVQSIKILLRDVYLLNLLYFFPMMTFLMIIYFWIIIQSEIIGTVYDKSKTFRRKIVMYVFNGDYVLCELYVYKFWGNFNSPSGHVRLLALMIMCLGGVSQYCARQKLEVDSHRMMIYKEMINDYRSAGVPITPQSQKEAFVISRDKAFEEKVGFLIKSIDDVHNARPQFVENTLEYLCSDRASDEERDEINKLIEEVTFKSDFMSFLEKSKKDIQDNDELKNNSKESLLKVIDKLQKTTNSKLLEAGIYKGINKSINRCKENSNNNDDVE